MGAVTVVRRMSHRRGRAHAGQANDGRGQLAFEANRSFRTVAPAPKNPGAQRHGHQSAQHQAQTFGRKQIGQNVDEPTMAPNMGKPMASLKLSIQAPGRGNQRRVAGTPHNSR